MNIKIVVSMPLVFRVGSTCLQILLEMNKINNDWYDIVNTKEV